MAGSRLCVLVTLTIALVFTVACGVLFRKLDPDMSDKDCQEKSSSRDNDYFKFHVQPSPPLCPSDWTKVKIDNDFECLKSIGKYNISEAYDACEELKAELPLPKNNKSNSDLYWAILKIEPDAEVSPLDLTDVAVEAKWVNSKGETPTWTNWSPSNPNNYKGKQDYAALWFPAGRWTPEVPQSWDDVLPTELVDVVCQLSDIFYEGFNF